VAVYVNSGIGAQIVMAPEVTFGVAPSLASAQPYEFNSETLELSKTIVQGKGIHAGGLHNRAARRVLTEYAAKGGITLDLPYRYLNQLLYQMFGSNGQTAAALTQDLTTGAYKAVHAPGTVFGSSMSIQKGVPSVDGTTPNPFTYTGMKLTDWTISVATGALAMLATNWDGRNELTTGNVNGDPLNASAPALATFSEAATNNTFHFRQATLYTGGTVATASGITTVSANTALGNVKSAEIKYGFKLNGGRYFLGSNGFKAEQIEEDFREITGKFDIEWLNAEAQYIAYASDTPTCLQLAFVAGGIGSGADHATLTILIPQIYLDGESPKVSGPKVVEQAVPFTGLDDGVNNPIQATYWTLDVS
jgi:hypothetical protein